MSIDFGPEFVMFMNLLSIDFELLLILFYFYFEKKKKKKKEKEAGGFLLLCLFTASFCFFFPPFRLWERYLLYNKSGLSNAYITLLCFTRKDGPRMEKNFK